MEGFWETISKHTHKQGLESILIYPKITDLPANLENSNIIIKEHNFQDVFWKSLIGTYKLIKEHNVQYIYLTDSPSYSLRYLVLRLFGIKKIIVHDHTPGTRTKPEGIKKILKKLLQRTPLYTADYFIAVTGFVYDRLTQVACIPQKKCFVARNGIHSIDLNKSDLSYSQQAFNISLDKTIVVTTGRATHYKGIGFFIECANEIINNKNLKQFHFLYCGDGPDMQDFKRLVSKYKLQDNFTFSGKREDVRSILPSCHIGFHAATGEVGYSLSILEYMSSGLVTIVPDNNSTSLATRHNETGYLYDRLSITSAVNSILKASENNALNKKIRDNAKKYIDNHLTIEHTHESLRQIISKIIIENYNN